VVSPGEREEIKREVLDDVKKALDKQKEDVRDEIRAQLVNQAATRALEEELQSPAEKKKLELFEVDGFYRVRPELFYDFDLRRGADPNGFQLFPRPGNNPASGAKALADANMRFRIEPTLNVSEDVRIHAQIDMLDNLIFGSTPEGGFGLSDRTVFVGLAEDQVPPTANRNWINNSILVKRAWGEVTTPVGQFVFGRMGNQWGLGMYANAGNCTDCDFGDTVDRFMFVAKVADYYVVPIIDFVSEGPTSISTHQLLGQPFDLAQIDDARDYSIIIAKRDTDLEISRKLQANQTILNYGLYFTYRRQAFDAADFESGTNPYSGDQTTPISFVPRDESLYIPDAWFKLRTRRLRVELELASVLGSIGSSALTSAQQATAAELTLRQLGVAGESEYRVLDSLSLGLDAGFASGDRSPGMGNLPGRTGTVQAGMIEGPQFCTDPSCAVRDTNINNFRFSRDYRIDLILWREIFNGITDAIYVKPGIKYDLTEGFTLWSNLVYSRAVFKESTPSAGQSANLGIEIDAGARFSGDGFTAAVAYGVLFPMAGLNNNTSIPTLSASTAQTVRGWFVIKY
jgi:uncharacterized protein (TIGR04551 family)